MRQTGDSTEMAAAQALAVGDFSPIARALTKNRVGDAVRLMTPTGEQEVEIVAVSYLS